MQLTSKQKSPCMVLPRVPRARKTQVCQEAVTIKMAGPLKFKFFIQGGDHELSHFLPRAFSHSDIQVHDLKQDCILHCHAETSCDHLWV